jgi:thymidylate synthase
MRYFDGTTADDVWRRAAIELKENPDYSHDGRNGLTREILPCVLRIRDPRQRWILSRSPPYNPAFGLVEFIWILTGNNESRVVNFWNPGLPKYSGGGETYHGAYGYRLRHEFGLDQIKRAYDVLSSSPETRQAVLQIWKPDIDLPEVNGKPVSPDIPCNMMSLLKIRDGRLHWSQIMRSNDIMRGLPYNIIQFTMLQEVMAAWLNVGLGEYFHHSDSLHMYEGDIGTFSVEICEGASSSRQPISLSFQETGCLCSQIYRDLTTIAHGNLKQQSFQSLFQERIAELQSRYSFLADVLRVIASDAATRYGWNRLSYEFANSCNEGSLKIAALAWLSRQE